MIGDSPCNLCPRMCGADRSSGERGACGAPTQMLVARAALHFWEEPPLSGLTGSGAVFFTHCPLRCVYCQNATIAAGEFGVAVTPGRLADTFLDLERQGALNINCVTPTHYSMQIAETVELARQRGLELPIVWNTSGYERAEVIRQLEPTVDVYLADFKYSSSDLAKRYSNAEDYPRVALQAIDAMVDAVGEPRFEEYRGQVRMARGVIVRHLMLPGALEASKQAVSLLHARYGDAVLYSIMNQYTPVMPPEISKRFPELAASVPTAEYEELLDFADSIGMDEYFWQDAPANKESFIPVWDGTGLL